MVLQVGVCITDKVWLGALWKVKWGAGSHSLPLSTCLNRLRPLERLVAFLQIHGSTRFRYLTLLEKKHLDLLSLLESVKVTRDSWRVLCCFSKNAKQRMPQHFDIRPSLPYSFSFLATRLPCIQFNFSWTWNGWQKLKHCYSLWETILHT